MVVECVVGATGPAGPVPVAGLVAVLRALAVPELVVEPREDGLVGLAAPRVDILTGLAEPIGAWWQGQTPAGSELVIEGPYGGSAISFARPDIVVELVGHSIGEVAGQVTTPAGTPKPANAGRSGRRRRLGGFTAGLVGVDDDGEVLCVGVAEQPDGRGRSLIFQAGSEPLSDPDVDNEYCLVTETQATVYGGIKDLRLHRGVLRVELTRQAAATLGLTTVIDVDLTKVADESVQALRAGLRRIFTSTPGRSRPTLDLGDPPDTATPSTRRRRLRGQRIAFQVSAIRGELADITTINGTHQEIHPAAHLAHLLAIPVDQLLGCRFTAYAVRDRFGITYTDYRPTTATPPNGPPEGAAPRQ